MIESSSSMLYALCNQPFQMWLLGPEISLLGGISAMTTSTERQTPHCRGFVCLESGKKG